MTSRLDVYNDALRNVGERSLASLTENREARRVLDEVWDANGVRYCLEQGLWVFAKRVVKVTHDADVTSQFGYHYAFTKPDDFVRTMAVCSDEYFNVPLTRYSDETGNWLADIDPLYVMYVSDDPAYGGNLGAWPETFSRFVGAYFAAQIAARLTQAKDRADALDKKALKLMVDARSKDAMENPASFPPMGSWASSRLRGTSRGSFDRGNPSQLIG